MLAGITFHIFHEHNDRLKMANIAQLVNCLQSLFVAHEDKFILTPNYHVFDMYRPHMGAQAVRTLVSAPRVSYTRNEKPATLFGLAGSASLRDKTLTLTVVNPSPDTAREAEVGIAGATARSCTIRTLTAPALDAHNTFEQPDVIASPPAVPKALAGDLVFTFPPASVTAIVFAL